MSILFRPLLVLLLITPAAALGWGRDGHSLIGLLAERQLSPATLSAVQQLLVDEANPTLAGIASWPDAIRGEEGWRWTAPMHYVNFADASCLEEKAGGCADRMCVFGAIERYREDLADSRLSRAQRVEALKFLVHFVGDAHQPLHAGYRPDQGGNLFQINIDGVGTNLHAVWDSRVLPLDSGGLAATADRLAAQPTSSAPGTTPQQWAGESCRLTDDLDLYPARPGTLPTGYLQRMRPYAEVRVKLAAMRLAQLLEEAFAERR